MTIALRVALANAETAPSGGIQLMRVYSSGARPCTALIVSSDPSCTARLQELLAGAEDGVAFEHAECSSAARGLLAVHADDFGVLLRKGSNSRKQMPHAPRSRSVSR